MEKDPDQNGVIQMADQMAPPASETQAACALDLGHPRSTARPMLTRSDLELCCRVVRSFIMEEDMRPRDWKQINTLIERHLPGKVLRQGFVDTAPAGEGDDVPF